MFVGYECLMCVCVYSSGRHLWFRAAEIHVRRVDTGPVLVIVIVCFDDDKGTSHTLYH